MPRSRADRFKSYSTVLEAAAMDACTRQPPIGGSAQFLWRLTMIAVCLSGLAREAFAGTTWDGTATSSGTASNIDRAVNWTGDALPAFDGSQVVTFGSGGSYATISTNAGFLGIAFTRSVDFTMGSGGGVLSIGAAGLTSTTTKLLTLATPVALTANQNWSLLSSGSITVTGVIGDDGNSYGLTRTGTGAGVLVLAGANTYRGSTSIETGILQLDFARAGAPGSDIISGSSALVTGGLFSTTTGNRGATLVVTGSSGQTNSQAFNGLTLADGVSVITATSTTSNTVNLAVGGINRSAGSFVRFALPTTGSITTTRANTNGILGAWALVAGTDWATSAAASGTAGAITAYAAYTSDAWAPSNNTNVTTNSLIAASSTTNSLRFFGTTDRTVTLAGANEITSGGILATDSSGTGGGTTGHFIVTGGTIRSGAGSDFFFHGNTQTGSGGKRLEIASALADNGGTGLIVTGPNGSNRIVLSGRNTYTGRTMLLGNSLWLASYDDGVSGPLGAGGAIEFGGGRLFYSAPANTTDYSTRFTDTANQLFQVVVDNSFSSVNWSSSLNSAAGGLAFTGAGELILTGSNTFPSGVTVLARYQDNRSNRGNFTTLTLGSADAIGTSGPISTGASASYYSKIKFTSENTQDIGSRLASTSSSVIDTNGQTVTFATAVAGSQGLAKVGYGDLVLSGSNTFTGTLQIWGGSVVADSGTVGTVLASTAGLRAGGVGAFRYKGAVGAARSQAIPGLTLTSGQLTIDVDNLGTSTTLNFAGTSGTSAVTRAVGGGSVDFSPLSRICG